MLVNLLPRSGVKTLPFFHVHKKKIKTNCPDKFCGDFEYFR